MNRRGFITGLVSFVAAPAIVRVGSLMPVKVMSKELEVYGRSPGMIALQDLEFLEGMSQRIMQTIIYGNCEWTPQHFTGFEHLR